ncbi:MAG: galactonate dehydratase [Alphaproteobacteria bacterium]|nr:galactonate dehydratase [Alphaproteobacteria bacterium]MDA8004413.1 galactonate dehydratase [Alphaproteobacteria bacterium]MDA8006141.1 galactonate dehydratase [Alphaproteobacteria bacterium]MDA8013498.1 galactonate dehydratase [Alphaproteobacteria bacterium]
MKISALRTFMVPPRWVFLKIETDEGLAGWGEPVLEGHGETMVAAIKVLEDLLLGADPMRITDIWQTIYRGGAYRGGPVLMSAISGVDMALWDIKGKAYGQPVHQLLGGPVRDKIRTYRWTGGDRPRDLIQGVLELRAAGFDAVKFNVCEEMQIVDSHAKIDAVLGRLQDIRDAVGNTMDLAFDFHGRVHYPTAKVLLAEIEPLRPLFVEDPVAAQNIDAAAALARTTSVPLALGERLHSRGEFKQVFATRAAAVVNPDTAHVGGISEMIRIGHLAEIHDVALAPHCPLGPVALAACLQVDAVCHNAFIQEQSLGIHYNQGDDLNDCLAPQSRFVVEDGFLAVPRGPGLGIEVDEDAVAERAARGHRWRPPVWRHPDGSVAEW